jgi:hypothetical protein
MCVGAASSSLRAVLAAPAQPAECLGVTRGALYLKTAEPPGVLVVLTHDAVRLPCGLVLPTTSEEAPFMILESYAYGSAHNSPGSWRIVVGNGAVSWAGPAGPVVVRAVREWAPARPPQGPVTARALAAVRASLSGADPGVRGSLLAGLGAAAAGDHDAATAAVTSLLGAGPGLTPSGDDVLAGFLVGAAAFGLDATALREAVAVQAPARTTALSAALLWHAVRGECIDELAGLAAVLTSQRCGAEQAGRAVSRLLSVGHTSGAALAFGLVTAAEAVPARPELERRAARRPGPSGRNSTCTAQAPRE